MDRSPSIPTWSELFGSPDTKEADSGRSLTSPAAYLVDLLQLLRSRFDPKEFDARRPDIKSGIMLTGEQSFSLKRQLDIVNGLLGAKIQGDKLHNQQGSPAETVLGAAARPFSLPFEYQHERIRQLLVLLRTSYRELYLSFAKQIDVDVLARERLGLSPGRAASVVNDLSRDAAALNLAYGLAKDETLSKQTSLDWFKQATHLDGPSLRLLLFSRLSQIAPIGTTSESAASASQLFVNNGLGGFMHLDKAEEHLVWSGASTDIPNAWFDRVHRLLCLSRWTGIDLPTLDLVLRQLCQNVLDLNALRRLAVLVHLGDSTKAPLDVLCAVFSELDGAAALGAGDDPLQPASLFDRVFNGAPARLSKRYLLSGSSQLPQTYTNWNKLEATGDVLLDVADNKLLRGRIQTSLEISAADLTGIITRFRDRATTRNRKTRFVSMDRHSLSLLHRVVRLAEFVDLPPLDLLTLVDLLETDPNLRVLNAFDLLYHEDVPDADLYLVLEEGTIAARSWLIQNIIAVAAWAAAAGFEPADLAAIVVAPGEATSDQKAQLLATAQALRDAFLPTALTAALLQSDVIDERTARVALAVFQEPEWGLVSSVDPRLAIWNKHPAHQAASTAIAALHVVSAEDIESLGLGDDLAAYMQSLLVYRGVLDGNGILRQQGLPALAGDLLLEPDGSAQFGQIFDFLYDLYAHALAGAAPTAAQDPAIPVDGAVADATNTDGDQSATQDMASSSVNDGTAPVSDAASSTADDTAAGNPGTTVSSDPATDIELHLFPSDLLKLGFTLSEAREWIDRLTFLQVLDSTGMVRQPSLFNDPANRGNIEFNVGLNPFSGQIHAWLTQRRDRWLSAALSLPEGIWEALPLTGAERQALEQNLIFNDHIDTARRVVDKTRLAALTANTFELALPFYRHRRGILNALQAVVSSAQDDYLAVTPDGLKPLADKFTGIDIIQRLSTDYLDSQGRLSPAAIVQIDQAQPPFNLGSVYTAAQSQSVWNLLQQVRSEADKYRLTDAALASVNITGEHASNVIVSLCADGCLQPDRSLTPEQVKRFSLISSANDFTIPGYTDYARDVFFLIHDVAVAAAAAVKALTTSFQAAANAQESAVLAALGSQIQLSPEAASSVLQALLRNGSSLTAGILQPVLRAVFNDAIAEPPSDRTFRGLINRAQAFANFADKLRMTPDQIKAAFEDQQLFDKFPEGITLPAGLDAIDALWAGPSGQPSGSFTLSAGDFLNLASFAANLEQPARPIDIWLASQLTPATTAAVAGFRSEGSDPASLEKALVDEINRLLLGPSLYDTQRFSGVTFRASVQKLITKVVQGGDYPTLNRLLLEDAYPELARNQLYLFRGPNYWTFDANTLELNDGPLALETLSVEFKGLPAVDAVYTLPSGEHWFLAEGKAWRRAADGDRWVQATGQTARPWGRVKSSFDDPKSIDGALVDHEGRIHLFSQDQYVRYSQFPQASNFSQASVDEGYPKRIAEHWAGELGFGPLPSGWDTAIDAAAGLGDEVTYMFKGDRFIASTEPDVEHKIADFWGYVRNNLAGASRVDAVVDIEGRCGIVVGDQVAVFSNSLESESLSADEGYPRKLSAVFPDLPEVFADGIDAGLTDDDGAIHLFRDQKCITRAKDGKWDTPNFINQRWGLVRNALRESGRVDAAFAGLDGKVYLFSGDQYVRYSGTDLNRADEGYPRTISADWHGLTAVDVAFVLDGKTYLFSSDDKTYVCYSTRDYTRPDVGYPKPIDENWWNLPAALRQLDFHHPDAVFVAGDGRIHLFRGTQTINFDHNHRWWSEPASIQEAWSSLPFRTVSAAFTARDGRSYIFSTAGEPSFVRYSDRTLQRIDDRFPKPVKEHFGKLVNNVERSGRVDAAVTIAGSVSGKAPGQKIRYRYLFSGDQFYRYSSDGQQFVDEGYPLRIQNNLRREHFFAHLDAPAEAGVDAVWADTGNVFVFISGRIHVASFDHFRQLDGLGLDQPRAAGVEDGRLFVLGKNGWRHILPPEAQAAIPGKRAADYVRLLPDADQAAVPRAVRTAPAQFQGKLSAILRGLDNDVYLFSDTDCYDHSLERQYPTGAAWGLVRNRIVEDERVDSALMGRDGKLYLFRGDQFVSYTPAPETPTTLPNFTDSNPLPVAAHWGGLNNVRHSFVRQGVTCVLEAPEDDGSFRYVRYFGTDYSQPNEPAPLTGDFSFWEVPADYVSRGFDRVDAVFAEGDDLILIRDTEFIHYDAITGTWSVPRRLSLRWPNLTRHFPDFEKIHAVVQGPDGKTCFFGDGTWLSHDGKDVSLLAPIPSRWAALPRNRIARSNRVDSTLVHGNQTFLFSGDEYVRYTGNEYEYVDEGYPKPVAGFLRREAPFKQLPGDIETAFETLKPEDVWVAGAFSTGGVVFVSLAGRTYALSSQVSRSYPLQQVAQVRNELLTQAKVDAAFTLAPNGALFLLSGDQYVRYSQPELNQVDDGYPRSIGESLLSELPGSRAALPPAFQQDIDAAIYDASGTLIIFKGKQFVRSARDSAGTELLPMDIKGAWGRVANPFLPSKADPQPHIDAAFVAPDHSLYVFKGNQYLRYSDPGAEFVDEGYPRAIGDEWADLPGPFKAGIDGAFIFDGRTYLCRDKQYVRYGDPGYRRMDPIYPQLFTNRWRASNDFLLGDLRTIQRYVALDQSHPSDDGSLTDFLVAGQHGNADPYALLASLFDWPVRDVEWLKRRDAFLDRPGRDRSAEVNFDIPQVLRLHSTLELCRRTASSPRQLYEQVWQYLYPTPSEPVKAADTLEQLLGTLYTGDDWTRIQRQLGDALGNLLRDAQVAWLLAHSTDNLKDVRDLSDLLLTDVEVDAGIDTSAIVEAAAAIQLYFYRYLNNLEPALITADDSARRTEFKKQWRWLQNYRVWEANRKVFLYPESYIRPELRTSRTSAFDRLRQNLQQGEITDDSVTLAYKQYLDEYTEVSRLVIAGGYAWNPDPAKPDTTELTLFGFTRTDPRRYYFRTASFVTSKDADGSSSTAMDWHAWQSLGIDINSERVYPVRAFGRTFVFWPERETIKPDDTSSATLETNTNGSTQTVSGRRQETYRVKVMYSFSDLSGQWTVPQLLDSGAPEALKIQSIHMRVSGMSALDTDAVESIVVDFTYDLSFQGFGNFGLFGLLGLEQSGLPVPSPIHDQALAIERMIGLAPRSRAKRLTADLTVADVNPVVVADGRQDILDSLFDPAENITNTLDRESVITIDTVNRNNEAPWYSFDYKGGSFLARPIGATAVEAPKVSLRALAGNSDSLPDWDQVDACLDGADGEQYLFNDQKMVYAVRGDPAEKQINTRWGLRRTQILETGQVDAAWQRDGVLFLSAGGMYVKYSHGLELADDTGERSALSQGQPDGVPNWKSITAAFTDKTNKTWFFSGRKVRSLDAARMFRDEKDIVGNPVTAALVRGEHAFLLSGDSYVRYTGPNYSVGDAGYPKPLAGNPDGLPEAGFKAAFQLPDGRTCYFTGTQHFFDNAPAVEIPNQGRWGILRTNILERGVDTAYRVDDQHYLFSGNEIARYTLDGDGNIPIYMDQAPITAELGSFGALRGAFSFKDRLYLVARDSFICCTVDQPERPLPEYPRKGLAGALVTDIRRQFNLPVNVADLMPTQYEVYALSLQGSVLLLDTGDAGPGQRVLRFDLLSGRLTRDSQPQQIDWATLRQGASAFVDLPAARYSFRVDSVLKTARGVPAVWDASHTSRLISAVWGGRPFDAAIPLGENLYFLNGDQFSTLPRGLAIYDTDGGVLVKNLRAALAVRTPLSGTLTPADLLSGVDAALPVDDGVYVFRGNRYAPLTGEQMPRKVPHLTYDLVRLTTSTAARLTRELFTGGVQRLLSLRTQEVGDTPGFAPTGSAAPSPTMIVVNPQRVNTANLPFGGHLDFGSANGVYLWEIFFHGPSLIAGMLSTAQRFEEAKKWYEYIFDPTEPADSWKFLPFLTDDVERIVFEIRDRLYQLDQKGAGTQGLRNALSDSVLNSLLIMNQAFQGERDLSAGEAAQLSDINSNLHQTLAPHLQALAGSSDPSVRNWTADLIDLVDIVVDLENRWTTLSSHATSQAQLDAYLDDPFDPHAIALQRPIAYRKATVMRYLDNLLDWGDMLFGQYTRESINEARMLYGVAWNVLGRRPESLGRRFLSRDSSYDGLAITSTGEYDMLVELKGSLDAHLSFAASLLLPPRLEQDQPQPYFFIPTNAELDQYWVRVADRLYKIRHGLNILGVKEPLALFAPPIDPMALVNAVAAGGLAGLTGLTGAIDVPHYRFTFLMAKAKELAQTVAQLGSELLAALEKRDAEVLYRLQGTQEGIILSLTRDMEKAQLAEAQTNLQYLQKAKESAQKRRDVYQSWLDTDYLGTEIAQMELLAVAVALNAASALFNALGAPLSLLPGVTVGLFSFGATEEEFEKSVQAIAMALQSGAGAVQGVGEILSITAQHTRSVQDWTLQRDLAVIDMAQLDAQIQGAAFQIQSAQKQIEITGKQMEHNKAVSDFYRGKFTNQELYEWMVGRLSDLHYQTYQLTLDMARAAERSFQFERGSRESRISFIQGQAWDSQRKGLLSGYTLGLALARMESAFIAGDARRLEITKKISLLKLDPLAFLKLKAENVCEFDLGEALFDYDFPGHYCRQMKTIAADLALGDGIFANATLTQLTSRTIMEPDPKAVGFLLSPKEMPPLSIRTDWKAQQQIALSTHTQYETNSGVFEMNFESERYLPFEGTGAVSRWRLELGGPPGAYDMRNLTDVTVTIKYTALQGGDAFAASVRGLLKPADMLRAFNLSVDFADAWQAFLQGTGTTLQLPLSQMLFPNMRSGAIRAVFTRYEYIDQTAGGASFAIDAPQSVALPDGKTVETSGLTIRAAGTSLPLKLNGDKATLRNAYLVMSYKGGVQ